MINFLGLYGCIAALNYKFYIGIGVALLCLLFVLFFLFLKKRSNKKTDNDQSVNANDLKTEKEKSEDISDFVYNEEISDETHSEVSEKEESGLKKDEIKTKKRIKKTISVHTPVFIQNSENDDDLKVLKRIFSNRLHQAEDEIKENYSILKNELLSYRGVKSRLSAPCDTFRANKEPVAKINIDGRKLIVYLKLDPSLPEYNDGTCPHRDMGHKYMYKEVPFRFTITSGLALRRCIKLISDMMENLNLSKNPRFKKTDYIALYPYLSDADLLHTGNPYKGNISNIENTERYEEPEYTNFDEILATEVQNEPVKIKVLRKEGDIDILKRVFINRLMQSDNELKENFSILKNELLSYRGVKSRLSAPCDTFRANKEPIAKINIDGRKLIVYLKLDPSLPEYNDGTCPHRDMGHKYMYKEVPFRFTITSGLALRRCIKLISDMMENFNYVKNPRYKNIDFVSMYPYLDDAMLLTKNPD